MTRRLFVASIPGVAVALRMPAPEASTEIGLVLDQAYSATIREIDRLITALLEETA